MRRPPLPKEMQPVSLIEDAESGDRFILYTTKDGVELELRFEGDEPWATQKQMSELFGIQQPTIAKHIKNIFDEAELEEESNIQKMNIADSAKPVTIYSLDVVLAVGGRAKSKQASLFRRWAWETLRQYLIKGFVLNERRLKNPQGTPDFFDELLERIRDIRSSEARMWTRILELASFCSDYDKNDKSQHVEFFAEIQNTMHWAVSQRCASEIVLDEVSAEKENCGVIHFEGREPTVVEARTAKNLLGEEYIKSLNHITSLTLEFFESQAEQRRPTTLPQFLGKMRELVKLDGRPVKKPGYAGAVSRQTADKWAADQMREWKAQQRALKESAGEKALSKIANSLKTTRTNRKSKS